MASNTQLATVSSENSPTNRKKTQIPNASTSPPGPLKHKALLPSSPNSQSTPYGKTHAGEVRRRTDRQRSPLPAPGVGQPSGGNSTNGFSRRQRRPNGLGSGGGGYNSGSDSDDGRKQRKHYDDRDDDVGIINREKRPAPPSSHYAEASSSSPLVVDGEEEERIHRSMQQSLALVEKEMTHYASPYMQQKQMASLVRSMPPGTRPGAIRSETYDSMLDYLNRLSEEAIESNTTALMRQQTSPSSQPEKAKNWMRNEFSRMVRDGKIIFNFVQLSEDPPYVMDLPGFNESFKSSRPTVLRVLVKDNTPRFAEVVNTHLLEDLGWWFCYETGTWCHNHVDQNKFSGRVIYQIEITGNIRKIWEVTDADEDLGFQRFLSIQRFRRKIWKEWEERQWNRRQGYDQVQRNEGHEETEETQNSPRTSLIIREPRGDRGVGDGGFAVIPSRPQV